MSEETEDIQEQAVADSLRQEMANDSGSRFANNDIDIQNKLIEPDTMLSGELALSNFQLGNISTKDYYGNLHDVNFALDCIDMPYEMGGFFLNEIGIKIMKKLDMAHIMSGSKGAKKWDSLTQDKKINVLRREGSGKKDVMSMFKRK